MGVTQVSVTGMTPFGGWQNFYVIVGSSAGALIGLQFVVMALVADLPRTPSQAQAGHAFATPNIVHFGAVLFLAAALCAPWHGIGAAAVCWGLLGLGGVAYALIVARRLRAQTAYQPVLEDWLFHTLLPFASYATLAATACMAPSYPRGAMFGVAAAALLLLFTGIHNAWDAATYHVFVVRPRRRDGEPDR
ncbi:MAG TPA: hypothetical protein VJP02_06220 [Candidatus Sulfotelmatobacter sp.]|nr:hypothetical protein [Candidatus Sulfotelmatobacter sp.]